MTKYKIREEGINGYIEVTSGAVVRTINRFLGKNDQNIIPIGQITKVEHDRKRLGTDVVKLHVSDKIYEWKIKHSSKAELMVREITENMK